MTIKIETYELPEFWACPLINGDDSGLEDADIIAIDKFCDELVKRYGQAWCINAEIHDGGDFRRYHDASHLGVLACNVATFTFDITPR